MTKDRFTESKKKLDIEIVIIENGKETARLKPISFVSCGMMNNPTKDGVKIEAMSFGTEADILFTLHLLIRELISKLGVFKVTLVLQAILAKNMKDFLAELKLRQHANRGKSGAIN